jgi:hypothetical protein
MIRLLVLKHDCNEAVTQVTHALTRAGLLVVRSFDFHAVWSRTITEADLGGLRSARSFDLRIALTTPTECTCPHHGTEPCDCQMVVMLIYDMRGSPATLVAHSHDGQTWIELVDTPEQRPAPNLAAAITQVLNEASLLHLDHEPRIIAGSR